MTPAACSLLQSTLWADPGFGKTRKSHRANAQAIFAKLRGSNYLILRITSCEIDKISSWLLMHKGAHAHAMVAMCGGANSECIAMAEAEIAAISGASQKASLAKAHTVHERSDGRNLGRARDPLTASASIRGTSTHRSDA